MPNSIDAKTVQTRPFDPTSMPTKKPLPQTATAAAAAAAVVPQRTSTAPAAPRQGLGFKASKTVDALDLAGQRHPPSSPSSPTDALFAKSALSSPISLATSSPRPPRSQLLAQLPKLAIPGEKSEKSELEIAAGVPLPASPAKTQHSSQSPVEQFHTPMSSFPDKPLPDLTGQNGKSSTPAPTSPATSHASLSVTMEEVPDEHFSPPQSPKSDKSDKSDKPLPALPLEATDANAGSSTLPSPTKSTTSSNRRPSVGDTPQMPATPASRTSSSPKTPKTQRSRESSPAESVLSSESADSQAGLRLSSKQAKQFGRTEMTAAEAEFSHRYPDYHEAIAFMRTIAPNAGALAALDTHIGHLVAMDADMHAATGRHTSFPEFLYKTAEDLGFESMRKLSSVMGMDQVVHGDWQDDKPFMNSLLNLEQRATNGGFAHLLNYSQVTDLVPDEEMHEIINAGRRQGASELQILEAYYERGMELARSGAMPMIDAAPAEIHVPRALQKALEASEEKAIKKYGERQYNALVDHHLSDHEVAAILANPANHKNLAEAFYQTAKNNKAIADQMAAGHRPSSLHSAASDDDDWEDMADHLSQSSASTHRSGPARKSSSTPTSPTSSVASDEGEWEDVEDTKPAKASTSKPAAARKSAAKPRTPSVKSDESDWEDAD